MAKVGRIVKQAEREANRSTTHLLLGMITLAGCYLTAFIAPNYPLFRVLTVGLGYISLLYTVFSLLIGPFKLWRVRRVPVNLDLRRDVGIWAGITGLLHVLFALWGRNLEFILRYYFGQFTWFGAVNYVGLIATLILIVLLATSNDLSLRWLRGPLWKAVQRTTYPLLALVLAHTFGYEYFEQRGWGIAWAVIILTGITLATQAAGFVVYRARQNRKLKVEG